MFYSVISFDSFCEFNLRTGSYCEGWHLDSTFMTVSFH